MVITDQFPLDFSGGKDEHEVIVKYIKGHYGELLGDDVKLLDLPNGLDLVLEKVQAEIARVTDASEEKAA